MSPQVKAAKDFDDTLSTKKRSPPPHQEPQHLPPPPPAPRLSLPALGSFTTPPSSPQDATTTSTTATTSSDYDDSYTAFYSSIPTVADSLYTTITPVTTTSTATPSITTKATTANNNNHSNNPYLYHPYSTTFTGSIEYQYHASLGSRTPMQVVAISNHKLNSDIFSSRSLSIHRRILVKNLLTLLYEMNPMLDWFDDASGLDVGMYDGDEEAGNEGCYSEPLLGEDEQNGWIEQTLSAAGLSDEDEDYDDCDSSLVFDRMSKDLSPAKTTPTISMTNATQQEQQKQQQKQSNKSKKSKNGRGSSSSSSVSKKKDKKVSAAVGSGMVDQSTPNIKNASVTIPPPQPPQTRQNKPSGSPTSTSIGSVLPSFPTPPAPTNRTFTPPPPPTFAPPSPAHPVRQPQPQQRTTYTLSPPSSSSSASSTTSSSPYGPSSSSSGSGNLPLLIKSPIPRPKSIELPQSLNNYLSAVFDVDWSVELPTMEDSLFTFGGSPSSSSSPMSLSLLGTSPPKNSYLNGSLLTSSPKRRSYSSTTSTTSSSSFSSLSKSSASATSSSSSLSSVDSWTKSPPLPATQTTTTSIAPRGATTTTTSSEIMVAKAVDRPYQGNSKNTSMVNRGATGVTSAPSAGANSLPPIRYDIQRAAGSGPTPTKGGAVPRAGDGQNAPKGNSSPVNNNNTNNNNRIPAFATPTGTSPPKPVTRKTTLVPGRRSSLLHTGQMPSAVSSPRKSPPNGPSVVGNSNSTPITIGPINGAASNTSGVGSASNKTSPPSPPINTSFANGYLSAGSSNNDGHKSGSGSGSGSPGFARRTSSLPPMERPAPVQRNPSSENVASSAGLPRPLLAKSYSSPIVIGSVPAANSSSPALSSSHSYPSPSSSGTSGAAGSPGKGHHYDHNQSNGYNPATAAGGFPVVRSRSPPPPHTPRKVIMMPPIISPPPSTGPSNPPGFAHYGPASPPPRSPSRSASISSYVLTPAPAPSSSASMSYGSSISRVPILPPLFPVQNQKQNHGSQRSSPTSPSSPTGGSVSYQYQPQHLAAPSNYTRSTSDDQIHARSTSSSPSPPPLSKSPSPTGSSSSSSSAASLSSANNQSSLAKKTAGSYGVKASKSSPDLTTGLTGSTSDSKMYYLNGSSATASQEGLVLHGKPSPSLPVHYQTYSQKSFTYQANQTQHHHQQSYSYSGSGARDGGNKAGVTSSAPIPRIAMSPPSGPSPSQVSGGSAGNRWATMKTMFSLKTTGHGGK
ncbi:MAG: hypothetical protein J3R72DRAFT_253224 [Linnemannia gamsii]|nr:MAG: hypothetical protein J3R72DRAFT_253224 [Linnemannia gamsii]